MGSRVTGVLLFVLLVSCAGSYNSTETLRDEVNHFNDAVRWGQYYRAARWIQQDSRAEWLSTKSDWGTELRVAEYEVVDTEIADDGRSAQVRVVISWYRMSELEVQTSVLSQRWERDGREWTLASEETIEGTPL